MDQVIGIKALRFFRCHSGYRPLLVAITLLGLLLQAESAFACRMMEDAGPSKECCCGDKPAVPTSHQHADQRPCCDFSLELSFKSSDDDSSPLLISTQSGNSPPLYAAPGYTFSGSPRELAGTIWRRDFDPGHPGTQTYLTTLRLRI